MSGSGRVGVASVLRRRNTFVVDMMVEKKKVSALEDNTIPESFSPLTTPVTTTAGNAYGMSSLSAIATKLGTLLMLDSYTYDDAINHVNIGNGDYDDDPYDDDMYEGQDLSHELQAICDNLDIRVRGRKKK
ncbi:hypothetical protein Tco_0542428 [Tanacetum coccineum]